MTRITATNVEMTACNLLDRLKRQGKVPANALLVITRAEPSFGISWGVRVVQEHDGPLGGRENVPTVLDRALDGITTSREAWQILTAIMRTLDYPWETWTVSPALAEGAQVSRNGEVTLNGEVIGRVEFDGVAEYFFTYVGGAGPFNTATEAEAVNSLVQMHKHPERYTYTDTQRPERPARDVSVALDGDVSVDGEVYGRVESTSTGAWLAIAEGARNGSRHRLRQEAIDAVVALADTDH